MIEQDYMISHFDSLASKYDALYEFLHVDFTDLAIKQLEVKPDDKIVDIGGGTGTMGEMISKKCGLRSKILVVDPSSESIELARQKEGVSALVGDMDQFLSTTDSQQYNKYIMCSMVHFIRDKVKTFATAYQRLPIGGQILIIRYSEKFPFPLWKEAARQVSGCRLTSGSITEALTNAGFKVNFSENVKTYILYKETYLGKLRNRIFSVLGLYSDDEIEAGIEEMKETVFKDSDSLTIENAIQTFHATK